MSLLPAVPLVPLFFFTSFAVAGISAPNCPPAWKWSFNTLGQSPCMIAAYMMSTCNGGSFTVWTLDGPDYSYIGPSGTDNNNLCKCSGVAYSLLSACDGCQGSDWITWSEYVTNCTKTMPPSSFPNPIPDGTRLPQWALLDVVNENDWDFNKSYALGGSPDLGPGTILGPSGPSVSTSTGPTSISASKGSSSGSVTVTPTPIGGHSSNTGAIAGGVVGSIAAISIFIAALLYYLRRRRPPTPSALSAPTANDGEPGGFNPLMDQLSPRSISGHETVASSLPETTISLPRPYDPEDPTTYPTYQGISRAPTYSPIQSPSSSSSKNLYTVVTPPNSQGQGSRYSGLPIV